MNRLPSDIRRWIAACVLLWLIVPLRALAEIVPGLEAVADKLTGKSVDYLLMVTTLAAITCTGYVIKKFIDYVIQSKADDMTENEKRVADMKSAHESTREDFQHAVRAINDLTTEIRASRK